MKDADQVRQAVSRAYSRVVDGGGCCSTIADSDGVAVQDAGYRAEELASLPGDAVVNARGCGNPLAFSEVREGDVVLDLGCGAGIDLLLAGRKVGKNGRAIGVDMTDAMIDKARQTIASSGMTQVEVRKGLIESLPVEDGSVDWVISNCVVNLSPEKQRVFAEIFRVLKPGGRVRISDIVASDMPDRLRHDESLHCSCVAGAISESQYVAALQAAGLVDVKIEHRLHYTASQLEALIGSDFDASEGCHVGGFADAAAELEGRVASVTVAATKPLK